MGLSPCVAGIVGRCWCRETAGVVEYYAGILSTGCPDGASLNNFDMGMVFPDVMEGWHGGDYKTQGDLIHAIRYY
jgi:hypothetical protein